MPVSVATSTTVTARNMVDRAMRLARILGAGTAMTASEGANGLYALNSMLNSWQLERLSCYAIHKDESLTWTANAASMTVGSGGGLNITRPIKIEDIVFTYNSTDYPVEKMLTREQYDAIPIKTNTSSFPQWAFYDPAFTLANLYVYPVPSAALTLAIYSWQTLQNFGTLDTTLSLPPGYQKAIETNLAIEIAPEYNRTIPDDVRRMAAQAKANIKTVNAVSMVAQVDGALFDRARPWNIYADR